LGEWIVGDELFGGVTVIDVEEVDPPAGYLAAIIQLRAAGC
jgi:hypothetical protein